MAKSRICECCKGEFLELDMRGTLCVCCYDFIEEYQDKENKVLEKALELACRVLCNPQIVVEPLTEIETVYGVVEYFKEQAKEMMKSE